MKNKKIIGLTFFVTLLCTLSSSNLEAWFGRDRDGENRGLIGNVVVDTAEVAANTVEGATDVAGGAVRDVAEGNIVTGRRYADDSDEYVNYSDEIDESQS
ncbi:MAG: hypothetical protein NTX86_03950 [Candidatus Dependentiae bacterium]|nr:hypothetical protein [Candidatus Dependentiae bacterium]